MTGLDWDGYVSLLVDLFSNDPIRVADANDKIFKSMVTGEDRDKHPALALVDAEQRVLDKRR